MISSYVKTGAGKFNGYVIRKRFQIINNNSIGIVALFILIWKYVD